MPDPPATSEPKKFEYLPPTPDLRRTLNLMNPETSKQKLVRRCKEQPLIPIGSLCTAGALIYGLVSMKRGDRFMSQRMMRLRIMAQGFTVMACLAGVFHTAKSQRTKSKAEVEPK